MYVFSVLLQITLFVVLGIFIVKIKLVDASFRVQLSKFVMNVALPCLIADTLASQTFDGHIDTILLSVVYSFATLAVLFVIGQIAYIVLGKNDLGKTARFGAMFSNFTFIGFAVMESLYGDAALFSYTLFTLPVRLIFYSSPSFLLAPHTDHDVKPTARDILKKFISAPIIAVAVGLVLYLTGLELPSFVSGAVKSLRAMSSPLGMLICGMSLASMTPKVLWERKKVFSVVLVRNIICPAVIIALLALLPLEHNIKLSVMVFCATPVPSLLTTFSIGVGRAEQACADASAAVLASTVASLATIPLWVWVSGMVF